MSERAQDQITRSSAGPFTPVAGGLLQRKCACGTHTMSGGQCPDCKDNEGVLQRKASLSADFSAVPPIVNEVLRSPGQALDSTTRAFMEPRFGHDFSQVRVHTDAKAAESALAVNALAYTVGRDVVFGSRQHAPTSSMGRELLAHELAHVVQQQHAVSGTAPARISQPSDSGEANADQLARSALAGERPAAHVPESSSPILSRRVIPRLVHCTGGSDGAPSDPVAQLTTIVDQAEEMTRSSADQLLEVAELTRAGARPMDSIVDGAFDTRFGLPPEVKGGFMNRLTGAVRPTLDAATSDEMKLTAGRLKMIANQFGKGFVHYLCMSTTRSFGGCSITDCSRDAWACPNVNAIFLCPGFWGGEPQTSSVLLVHEASHMIWERVVHGASGSGGNFRNAECYASFVADVAGMNARVGLMPECANP